MGSTASKVAQNTARRQYPTHIKAPTSEAWHQQASVDSLRSHLQAASEPEPSASTRPEQHPDASSQLALQQQQQQTAVERRHEGPKDIALERDRYLDKLRELTRQVVPSQGVQKLERAKKNMLRDSADYAPEAALPPPETTHIQKAIRDSTPMHLSGDPSYWSVKTGVGMTIQQVKERISEDERNEGKVDFQLLVDLLQQHQVQSPSDPLDLQREAQRLDCDRGRLESLVRFCRLPQRIQRDGETIAAWNPSAYTVFGSA